MKLGLADSLAPRPPAILVLGEGALALQIKDDLSGLGLYAILVSELGLPLEEQELPRITDPDAGLRMRSLFQAFRMRDKTGVFEHSWVHPGVTLWGERAELEGWARQSGLSAITSSSKNLQLFWNVHQTLKLAKEAGVPTLVLSDEPVTSVREIEASINTLLQDEKATLPFVLKSAYRVRGGHGTRAIRTQEELNEWVPVWMNQIREASGTSLLFFERFLESARCYVQPFARLKSGEIEYFPVIDGSLMFEGKNWIEVCPAQNLDEYIRQKIEQSTRKFLEAADFIGVGNLCFLSNGSEVFFTEALGRLNFGYRLWENVARTKAVQWQLHSLAPALLTEAPKPRSKLQSSICGINLKIYAEDTWLKIPHPGVVHEVSIQTEWNAGASEGTLIWDVVPSQNVDWKGSGALGQITLFAQDWKSALATARDILKDIWISGGIQTNERFLHELISHPWVEESMFYTGFVDEEFIPKQVPDPLWLQTMSNAIAEVAPPLAAHESFLWMNHRLPPPNGKLKWTQKAELSHQGRNGVKGYFRSEDGSLERICVFPIHEKRTMVRLQNWFFSVRRSEKGKPLQLMALTSGRIHSIFFRDGSKVEPKQTVLIIESQQNLISHRLPVAVRLTKLLVRAEDEVQIGDPLAELERWSDNQT
ncbi:MAG: biotin/lipoyl-binding protein [Bdellovibrionales bacterium]|nr:biotin/lipoyl-binding protein [Oligoflexia bacterium]